ncbi:unnamed protein product [Ostreobium quekettii]|uniref:WW domain-containing protein n=1 Tax=Ostreobium quekettii TaxID=121088 RepID=A0A8S1J0C8_9CHLO|nr:unnamed protein product [Ostreobium quekettii]
MDEAQAVALYDETKARGAGAARFKHGLGFQAGSSDAGGRSGPRPVSAAPPQFVQQRPPGGAMPRPPIAGPRPPPGPPPPVVRGGHGGRPPPGAPPPGRPPQHMLLRPPGAPMPPMPMPPAGGLLPPPPHVAARPPFPPPPPMMPPRPPHPPMPPSGVPYLPPRGPLGRFPPPQPPGMPPPPQHTSFGPPPGGQPYGMPRLPIPGPPVPQPGYPGPPSETGPTKEVDQQSVQDAEEHQRKEGDKKQQALANLRKAEEEQRQKEEELRRKQEQESWTAHKADDTQVYYYNTMTGESSWERPQGFRGDAEKVAEKPKPVASERIEGTDWTEVKCEDKRKYYFNVVSQETVWTVPPEVSRSRAESASSRSRLPMVQGSGPPSAALPRPLPSAGPKGRGRTFPSSSTIGAAKRPFLQSKAQGPSETAVEQFKSFLQEKGVTGPDWRPNNCWSSYVLLTTT